MSTRICIVGAKGRMGQAILQTANDLKIEIDCLVIREGSDFDEKLFLEYEDKVSYEISPTSDVILDFSTYEASKENVKMAYEYRIPILIGTTGKHTQHDYALYAQEIPILWAPNTSLAWNIIYQAVAKINDISDFQFKLGEIHQKKKKDKPSGTLKDLNTILNTSQVWSLRAGDHMSLHQVLGVNQKEVIRFEHQVLDRSVFADDAIKEALWLTKQQPGLYSVTDFISEY
ncbi:MAG: hypothetical protein H6845_00885 [Alphaproteobacteria bacterium]|nr:MAG: hypothetical protein H6845_00885 [Alphaproteobacteria bacterium]